MSTHHTPVNISYYYVFNLEQSSVRSAFFWFLLYLIAEQECLRSLSYLCDKARCKRTNHKTENQLKMFDKFNAGWSLCAFCMAFFSFYLDLLFLFSLAAITENWSGTAGPWSSLSFEHQKSSTRNNALRSSNELAAPHTFFFRLFYVWYLQSIIPSQNVANHSFDGPARECKSNVLSLWLSRRVEVFEIDLAAVWWPTSINFRAEHY